MEEMQGQRKLLLGYLNLQLSILLLKIA